MAKRRPVKGGTPETKPSSPQQVLQPDYYRKFHCIGGDCEDSCCCANWRVDIDRATWLRYQACESETLRPMFRDFVQLEPMHNLRSAERYANIKFAPNQCCPFLNEAGLCAIHGELGPEALSDTCALYPRAANLFGRQREYGLSVSCPEAARVVLLHPEPTALVMGEADAALGRRGVVTFRVACPQKDEPVLNMLRGLIVRILQWRDVSLGARMMLVGSFLHEVGRVRSERRARNAADVLPALETYAALFADPDYVEAEFGQMPGDLPRKLQCTTGFLADFLNGANPRFKECLTAFAEGLLGGQADGAPGSMGALMAHYERIYDDYYLPYFRDKGYIYENYLVNEVLLNLFPFVRGTPLELYRAMVFNLSIIQVMLVGMAGYYKGLTDERVIQFIQSFARRSSHNDHYIRKLTEALTSKDSPTYVEVMWMLKER